MLLRWCHKAAIIYNRPIDDHWRINCYSLLTNSLLKKNKVEYIVAGKGVNKIYISCHIFFKYTLEFLNGRILIHL